MAQPTGTYSEYDAAGIREDLSDAIANIAPTDTPAQMMFGRGTADSTLIEFQTDTLAAAANNRQITGDDVTAVAPAATVRLTNRTQISTKPVIISGTLEAVRKAGRKSELGYQMARLAKELKNDVEFAICQNTTLIAGSDTVARQCRGLEGWIATNDSLGAGGVSPDYVANVAPVDGTQRAFSESLLKEVLRLAYTEGGNPDCIMCGPFNKQKISEMTGGSTRMDESEDMKLTASIDIYRSDFGTLKVYPNRFQRERTVFVLDKNYWSVDYLRGYQQKELARTGDAEKRFLVVEYSLRARQEKASGAIRDLTTT